MVQYGTPFTEKYQRMLYSRRPNVVSAGSRTILTFLFRRMTGIISISSVFPLEIYGKLDVAKITAYSAVRLMNRDKPLFFTSGGTF